MIFQNGFQNVLKKSFLSAPSPKQNFLLKKEECFPSFGKKKDLRCLGNKSQKLSELQSKPKFFFFQVAVWTQVKIIL